MKYMNKKTGAIAELVQESEKFKTVLLVYEDGNDTQISMSTLKRWWKKLPEEETTEQEPDVANEIALDFEAALEEEDVASDGTPYTQVMEEIQADAKQTAKELAEMADKPAVTPKNAKNKTEADKKPKKQPKTQKNAAQGATKRSSKTSSNVPEILGYIKKLADDMGAESSIRSGQTYITNYKIPEFHTILFRTVEQKSAVCLRVRSKFLTPELIAKTDLFSDFFDRKIRITELTDETKDLIDKILTTVRTNAIEADKKKEEK